jgi:glycosyltransferase involved in cell wall biosynthesis
MTSPRHVLLGDAESPHLLKWARALAGRVELYVASTRDFTEGFDGVVPTAHRLALHTRPAFEGGNVAVLRTLPRLAHWLQAVDADWIHAHYITSHGTLAWLAKLVYRIRARLISLAWGSDILIAPERSAVVRWVTRRVLGASTLCTSDSAHMAERMRALGAREVMVFPFGIDALPAEGLAKTDRLLFANRSLEALYAPQKVLEVFAALAQAWPDAELVVANDGSLRGDLQRTAVAAPWGHRVRFVGRLAPAQQESWYRSARWYLSLPTSDSVSVSVLEAMAHGCVPVLSDLPANRELVQDGVNGLIAGADAAAVAAAMQTIADRASQIARVNRAWIAEHAIFPQAVDRFLARLHQLEHVR